MPNGYGTHDTDVEALRKIRGGGEEEGKLVRAAIICCCACSIAIITLCIALSRNSACDASVFKGVTPPYDGQLFPNTTTLTEEISFLSKQVDVHKGHSKDNEKLGEFHDMDLWIYYRFSYQDTQGRVWFEAQKRWFAGFFKTTHDLWRCDDSGGDNWVVTRNTWDEPWFQWSAHTRIFTVMKAGHEDKVVAKATFTRPAFSWGSQWHMNLNSTAGDGQKSFAHAQQSRTGMLGGWSIWLEVEDDNAVVPNWVAVWLAALDDIDTSDKKH